MAKIFITGSADGLGQLAAQALIRQGHEVVLHARNEARAAEALKASPGAAGALIADLSSIEATKALAVRADESGPYDAVIHNAGIYQVPSGALSVDGFPLLLAVNTLAPYVLTCLMQPPSRLIYLSSDMHLQAGAPLTPLQSVEAGKPGSITYSETKLHDLILSMAVARRWPGVIANAIHPGWVPTKMGGPGAPDSLERGYETQVWLAVSEDSLATASGQYLHHKQPAAYHPSAGDVSIQDAFINICGQLTGVPFDATVK